MVAGYRVPSGKTWVPLLASSKYHESRRGNKDDREPREKGVRTTGLRARLKALLQRHWAAYLWGLCYPAKGGLNYGLPGGLSYRKKGNQIAGVTIGRGAGGERAAIPCLATRCTSRV